MELFEKDMIDDKKVAFQNYAIQVAQVVSSGFNERNPYVIYEIVDIGEEISGKEGEPTRILLLNEKGVVEYDSYVGAVQSLLKRNLKQDLPEVAEVLKGNFVPARDLYILTGSPPDYHRVMYSYAPITNHSDGIIGMVIISTTLKLISLQPVKIRTITTGTIIYASLLIDTHLLSYVNYSSIFLQKD
jgi:hypothetical protein